ncbi:MAG: TatD family hydrolase [bacterium]
MLVDTHAHLFMKEFAADRDAVVGRAARLGVAGIIDVGVDLETSRAALENAKRYAGVFASAGFHPHSASEFNPAEFDSFVAGNRDRLAAVGEIGLDYYRDLSPRRTQREALEAQLETASRSGLPVIFHCRKAHDDFYAILSGLGKPLRGTMHCFSGGMSFLKRALDLGLHVGVDAPITYPRSRIAELVRYVPPERLLIETDAPYLPPQPVRGGRNEPCYIAITAGAVAEALGVRIFQAAELTAGNAVELFGLPISA